MKRLTAFVIVALAVRATGVFGDAPEPSAAVAHESERVRTLTSEQASFAFGKVDAELGSSNNLSLLSDAEMEEIEGDGWGLVLRAAGRYVSRYLVARKYPRSGGGGLTFRWNNRRVFGIDVHGWRGGTRWYHRIHYHRRPGIGKHRPWQGW